MLKYGDTVPTIYGYVPDSYIIGLLKNAEWTDEEINNIDEEQLELVIGEINNYLYNKLQDRLPEFEDFCKRNKETCEYLQAINLQVAQYLQTIQNQIEFIEDWELEEVIKQVQILDATRWKIIRETIGDKAFIEMMEMSL
jgi:hypothetical protein